MGLYYVVLFTSGNEGMIMGDGGRFLKKGLGGPGGAQVWCAKERGDHAIASAQAKATVAAKNRGVLVRIKFSRGDCCVFLRRQQRFKRARAEYGRHNKHFHLQPHTRVSH